MKARISRKGFLYFLRAGEFKKQHCPFHFESRRCGDYCALFVEVDPSLTKESMLSLACSQTTIAYVIEKDFRTKEEE